MPVSKIEVNEYTCAWCSYKWINRINGKDGPTPERCAKCKRANWVNGERDVMTPKEVGLRRRIKGFNEYYRYLDRYTTAAADWPNGLTEKFLSIDNPRPTVFQLSQLMKPLGWDIHKHPHYIPDPDAEDYPHALKYDYSHYIPDPDKPGRMKYNPDYSGPTEYEKLVIQEAQKRIKIMVDIMKSRGIDYDIAADIAQTQQRRKEEEDAKPKKSLQEL